MFSHFSNLAALVLTWMVTLEPPSTPGHTPEQIAAWPDIAAEIADSAELAPLGHSPRWTAAVLTVWAWHESRFRRSVTGDKGKSLGLLQTWRGWGEPSVALSLGLMHESFRVCADRPMEERFAWYAAGRDGCSRRRGLSRSRVGEAERLMRVKAPAWSESPRERYVVATGERRGPLPSEVLSKTLPR
jgi:hypothetical protein